MFLQKLLNPNQVCHFAPTVNHLHEENLSLCSTLEPLYRSSHATTVGGIRFINFVDSGHPTECELDVDNESNGNLDVQTDGHISSFEIFNQVLESEQGIYVSTHAASCDVSNNLDVEEPDESSCVHYHLPPTPQFAHVENLGNVISSG